MPDDFPPANLMVIGDSLAQGCRSLTVNGEFCGQSWGARIAQTQGWRFVTPDFPIPVLFDLENEVRKLDTGTIAFENLRFEGLFERVRENLGSWLAGTPTSNFPCFDNLGLSGCLIDDLYLRTARSSTDEIARLAPDGATADLLENLIGGQIGELHLAINARFTLNPKRNPDFDDLTPLDWVARRRPKALIVQAGHNHGLYRIGGDAEVAGAPADSFTQSGGAGHAPFYDQWQELAARLAALPAEIETILVALLPKVGAAANLRPSSDERSQGYAPGYEPVLSTSATMLTGDTLCLIDAEIQKANERIRGILLAAAAASQNRDRLRFFDAFAVSDALDFKNSLDPNRRIGIDEEATIDNRYLDSHIEILPPFRRRLVKGGFQSIDGMHPTGAGYALLAAAAMNVLGLQYDRATLLERAYGQDTLLSDYPVELDVMTGILSLVRKLLHDGAGIEKLMARAVSGQPHVSVALDMMKQVFRR